MTVEVTTWISEFFLDTDLKGLTDFSSFWFLWCNIVVKGQEKKDIIIDKNGDSPSWKGSEPNYPNRPNFTILKPFLRVGVADQT